MDLGRLYRDVAELFAGSRPRTHRVGVELELISRDAGDGSVVPVERIRRAARGSSYARWLGFEPGGQVELSLPCCSSVTDLERAVRAELGDLTRDCAAAGVIVEPIAIDHRGQAVPLQLTSPRYTSMQEHFDRIGPAGRTMMRLTASTQVCLDWWPGRAGLEQWRLLQLAGPFVAALFARGGGPGSRLATWLEVDPGRTAFDDRLLGGDPVEGYVAFAAAAATFALPEDPEAVVTHHLSTLFPPVRPRSGYLEVRFLDALSEEQVPLVTTVLAALLYDDETRVATLRLLAADQAHLARHWRMAAVAPGELMEQALGLVALSLPGVRRAPSGYLSDGVEGRLRERLDVVTWAGVA